MGIIKTNKEISKQTINCGDPFNIKLTLTATPDIIDNPTDIVLVLDCSASMTGTSFDNLKLGAKKFIEIIDESTDGIIDNEIGNCSRIGIVSFSDTATKETTLITSVKDLNKVIDSLKVDFSTNHEDAFEKAIELFEENSSNKKVIVMFTDGKTTVGDSPTPITELAKSNGIIIYCIGLEGDTGVNLDFLNDWSSDPDESYVSITPNESELEDLFKNLAISISKPGATNIEIADTVNEDFKITSIVNVNKGEANILEDNLIRWTIDSLGETTEETAILEFSVKHIGNTSKEVTPNKNIDYQDNENHIVTFNSPTIKIICNEPIYIEDCPTPIDILIDGCQDSIQYDAGDIYLDSLGRILELNATIKNVCPNKRVALAVLLTEVDSAGQEYKRGMKTILIPAHTKDTCQDIKIKCIKFVLPEELDVNGLPNSICNERNFKVRFISHYIDNDFTCCNNIV